MNMPNVLTVQLGEEETLRQMRGSLVSQIATCAAELTAQQADHPQLFAFANRELVLEAQLLVASRALEIARTMAVHVLDGRLDLAFGEAERFAQATEGMWGEA